MLHWHNITSKMTTWRSKRSKVPSTDSPCGLAPISEHMTVWVLYWYNMASKMITWRSKWAVVTSGIKFRKKDWKWIYHGCLPLFRHPWRYLCAINIIWPPKMTPYKSNLRIMTSVVNFFKNQYRCWNMHMLLPIKRYLGRLVLSNT